MQARIFLILCVLIIFPTFILGSCSINPASENPSLVASPTPNAIDPLPLASGTPPSTSVEKLTVWIPDKLLKPDQDGVLKLIDKQIAKFSVQNPDIKVEIRIKKTSGKGNLLETLQSASLAAPGALPDLVLLTSTDMETSALKGLLVPFDGSTDLLSSTDWTQVTRDLSQVQGSNFGIPALADATVLASHQEISNIQSIYKSSHPIHVFINDPRGLFLMSLYLSGGGQLQNDPARPDLDEKALAAAISLIDAGFRADALNSDTLNINNGEQAVKLFTSRPNDNFIGWFSDLGASQEKAQIASVPGVDGKSASLARGWLWSMANPDPLRRQATIQLVEMLSEQEFLAEFARMTHLIPVRYSHIMTQNTRLAEQYQILQSAYPEPDGVVLVTTGSAFRDAVLQAQRGDLSADEIALQVVSSFIRP